MAAGPGQKAAMNRVFARDRERTVRYKIHRDEEMVQEALRVAELNRKANVGGSVFKDFRRRSTEAQRDMGDYGVDDALLEDI